MSSEIQPQSLTRAAANITTTEKNIIFKKYEVGRLLGCGGFAKVYHARNIHTAQSVAVKVMNISKIEKSSLTENIKREITIMRQLRHPNIIRIIEVLADKSKVFVILEFAKGGELFAKVAKGRFSEDLARRYFHQLVSAVGYCHSRGVYHRDLKPENMLLDEDWNLKVTDFGLSAARDQYTGSDDEMLQTLCGTPAYVAPEVLAKKGYFGGKVDVWSCGVILFVLTAGYLPFNDTNLMNLYRKIYKGEFKCPRWMSSELRELLHRLLEVNPESRITIAEILENSWFIKGGIKEVSFRFYDEDYNMKKNEGVGNDLDGSCKYLNAFDLISFSPGFNLSGLFTEKKGEECWETFLSGFEVENVVERVEDAAREVGGGKVVVERVKRGMGVRLEGQNGEFGLVVVVHRLTNDFVVVEVKKQENDVGPGHMFWKDKLRPKIRDLIFDQSQVGLHVSIPGPSNRVSDNMPS